MYTLPSDLFIKYVFKIRNLCCVRELLALIFLFPRTNLMIIKTGVSAIIHHLNLYGQAENSKWILFSRKTDVKCGYLRFLM